MKNFGVETSSSLVLDVAWLRIEVNGYTLKLSPTQYQVFTSFVPVSLFANVSEEMIIVGYRSFHELQTTTTLSRSLLIKHVSNLNARSRIAGLQFCFFQSGYILTLSSFKRTCSLMRA